MSHVGERAPRWGNRLTRTLGHEVLRVIGWRVEGEIPNREKFLAIAAPHTTGWDFPVAMVTLMAIGIRVSWLGVDWLFRYPLMRQLGGIPVARSPVARSPVDRRTRLGLVPQIVEQFRRRRRFILGLSPEGSRSRVVPWKTGFYRIATDAGVPIVLVSIDPRARLLVIGPAFEPSGDYQADMDQHIRPFYARFVEQHPDRFGIQ